jgi:hypothetical protein
VQKGGLVLNRHRRCFATPYAPSGPRGLSHGFPGKQGLPCGGPPASCVAVPAPHPWRTEGEGLDEVARRALLALVGAAGPLGQRGVGGAGVDEGQ